MTSLVEDELARSLIREGFYELPGPSRAWIDAKLADVGLCVGGASPVFGEVFATYTKEQIVERFQKLHALSRIFAPVSTPPDSHVPPPVGATAIEDASRTLILASRRLGRAAPLETGDWTDYVPGFHTYFSPTPEAEKKYVELRADWLAIQDQHPEQFPETAQDVREWAQFRGEWEAGTIPNSDVAGRLNAEVIRINRVRAVLLEHASGKPAFVQDLPDRTQNIPLEDALPFASAVDAWARKSPFVDALTNPAGPAIKLPGIPKLPGGILGGLAIVGGTLLAANTVLQAAVRKALGA